VTDHARPLIADLVEQIMCDAERIARESQQLQQVHKRAVDRSARNGASQEDSCPTSPSGR
jgi:hypothetical protein